METKFGPSGKMDKKRMTSDEMNFFRTGGYNFFEHKKERKNFERI
jgi:hypothetical protein